MYNLSIGFSQSTLRDGTLHELGKFGLCVNVRDLVDGMNSSQGTSDELIVTLHLKEIS
jgi:hypothetical protein